MVHGSEVCGLTVILILNNREPLNREPNNLCSYKQSYGVMECWP